MNKPRGRPHGLIADGTKLRKLRKERGLDPIVLARQIGRNRRTIFRAEACEPISDVTAYQIAIALSRAGEPVTPRDFIPGWPDDEETPAEALASLDTKKAPPLERRGQERDSAHNYNNQTNRGS